jgi:hypothetical protein
MNKSGWRDLIAGYYAATNLVYDKDQFKSKLRQLRHLWHFINDLRKASGLGRREDGSILATDGWWESRTVVCNQTYAQSFHVKMLIFLIDLYRFFRDTLSGRSSRTVGLRTWTIWTGCSPAPLLMAQLRCLAQSNTIDMDSSEESNDEQDDQLMPLSVGTKRASNTNTNCL